jgi:organic hydroperoxide reductase OsmC/OhrA
VGLSVAGRSHRYRVEVEWTGDRGEGTARYDGYGREHLIRAPGKPDVPGSSDPAFQGDADRWNPEELLIAAASACHKLWYLHLCAVNGVVVAAYLDRAEGVMDEAAGRFTAITLRPEVILAPGSDPEKAASLHHPAHEKCYIANSLSVPVAVEPVIRVAD